MYKPVIKPRRRSDLSDDEVQKKVQLMKVYREMWDYITNDQIVFEDVTKQELSATVAHLQK